MFGVVLGPAAHRRDTGIEEAVPFVWLAMFQIKVFGHMDPLLQRAFGEQLRNVACEDVVEFQRFQFERKAVTDLLTYK